MFYRAQPEQISERNRKFTLFSGFYRARPPGSLNAKVLNVLARDPMMRERVCAERRRGSMKNGFRVYDSDTHVNPAAEVLERYVDPGFRPRLAELEAYRLPVGQGAVAGVEGLHNYRVGTKYYRRVLGESAPRESFTGRERRWMGSKMPRPGV